MLNPYLETWNLCSATLGRGGRTSGAMFGGNIGPFHAVRAVTVAKRREYLGTKSLYKAHVSSRKLFPQTGGASVKKPEPCLGY